MNIHFHTIKLNYKILAILLILPCLFVYSFVVKASYEKGVTVPIVMYHSVLKDSQKSGKYIITPATLEEDLKYLVNNGYTTITMSDLISYVYEDTPLPEKPIILTFDDGHYNNLGYAVPLLEKYHMKGIISIVGEYTDTFSKTDEANLNYSYLRWKDIKQLIASGTIEFQNHTNNLHATSNGRMGCSKKSYESNESYSNILSNDILTLQKKFWQNTGYMPNTFTYPFGSISKASLPIIKQLGFKASLSCASGINYITKDPNCLYCLKRNNRPSGITSEDFFNNILKY